MKKQDLKFKNVVELRNGYKLFYHQFCEGDLLDFNGNGFIQLDDFDENLNNLFLSECDIVKVYEDYTLTKVLFERKEKPELTDDEVRKLKALKELGFNYIARNEDGVFCAFDLKPQKSQSYWYSDCSVCDTLHICTTNNLFQFVKWEDEEPYSIKELLNDK